ncbi:hypothetical protein AB0M31_16225 [Streptomyces sp. NPDC051773]
MATSEVPARALRSVRSGRDNDNDNDSGRGNDSGGGCGCGRER